MPEIILWKVLDNIEKFYKKFKVIITSVLFLMPFGTILLLAIFLLSKISEDDK